MSNYGVNIQNLINKIVKPEQNFQSNAETFLRNSNSADSQPIFDESAVQNLQTSPVERNAFIETLQTNTRFEERDAEFIYDILNTDNEDGITDEEYNFAMKIFGEDTDDNKENDTLTVGSFTESLKNYKDAFNDEGEADIGKIVGELSSDLNVEEKEIIDLLNSTNAEEKILQPATSEDIENFSTSVAKDKIQQDEDGNLFINVDSWSSNSENLDCASKIIKNLYGYEWNSKEGQEIYKALAEANPDTINPNNPDLIYAGAKINLVTLGNKTEEKNVQDEEAVKDGTSEITSESGEKEDATTDAEEIAKQQLGVSNGLLEGEQELIDSNALTFDYENCSETLKNIKNAEIKNKISMGTQIANMIAEYETTQNAQYNIPDSNGNTHAACVVNTETGKQIDIYTNGKEDQGGDNSRDIMVKLDANGTISKIQLYDSNNPDNLIEYRPNVETPGQYDIYMKHGEELFHYII